MIRIEGLTKGFAGQEVLRGVDLRIRDGETLAIIGCSGSGKSVLLKHIVGLLRPDSGRVLVDGEDIHALPAQELRRIRHRFGVLFQGGALFDSMTALENVAFPLEMFGSDEGGPALRRAQELLEMVQIPEAGSKTPDQLSGGQKKRVALARAIALEPAYVFYDEPTSGLDPQMSKTIAELIQDLSRRLSVTGVVVTHDIRTVIRIADRAAFLSGGKLRWIGTIDDLHRSEDSELLDFVKANEYRIGSTGED